MTSRINPPPALYIGSVPRPERQLIQRVRSLAQASKPTLRTLITGIGDDCAVLRPPAGHELLVTTDFSLEGVHFRREWHPPESVGHRCLTRGLSDIAAMGGQPLACFLSLGLPAGLPQSWVDRFYRGLLRLASEHNVALAGGDTAQSPAGVLADIMVLGSIARGKAVLRSGAKPGDRLYVTGRIGLGGSTVRRLYAGEKIRPSAASGYFYPQPRLSAGHKLQRLASAMIDISDGLTTDLSHICEESNVGALVFQTEIPIHRNTNLNDALSGGDDYELLFTSSKRVPREIAGLTITEIGEIIDRPGMWLQDSNGRTRPLKAKGWEHFSADTRP
ncbi:MAG TPA: thiamine-phosphate kinase [Terriglobales bacterium]|nr:thiamine-phosphate kinase [Terriglobales bacterium]